MQNTVQKEKFQNSLPLNCVKLSQKTSPLLLVIFLLKQINENLFKAFENPYDKNSEIANTYWHVMITKENRWQMKINGNLKEAPGNN